MKIINNRIFFFNLDYFDKLSDELVLHIFKFIPRKILLTYGIVCKRWYKLMYVKKLWYLLDSYLHIFKRKFRFFSVKTGRVTLAIVWSIGQSSQWWNFNETTQQRRENIRPCTSWRKLVKIYTISFRFE